MCSPLKSCGGQRLLLLLLFRRSPEEAEKAAPPLVPHHQPLQQLLTAVHNLSFHTLSQAPHQKFILRPLPSLLLFLDLFLPLSLPSSQSRHTHPNQRQSLECSSSSAQVWRSSPAHAAAPAGPAALPSAGQVEPESPHSPPTSPHYPRAGNFLLLGSRRWLGWDLTRALERGLNCQYSRIIFFA